MMGSNQYTTRRAGKRPAATQYQMRQLIQREGKPVEWLCELLQTGLDPSTGEPVPVATRVDAAKWLADKLVSKPKATALPGEGAIDVPTLPASAQWVDALEAEGNAHAPALLDVDDVEPAESAPDTPEQT